MPRLHGTVWQADGFGFKIFFCDFLLDYSVHSDGRSRWRFLGLCRSDMFQRVGEPLLGILLFLFKVTFSRPGISASLSVTFPNLCNVNRQ